MHNYRTAAMKMANKYEFSMALQKADTEAGSEDHDLAFEIARKLKLLERMRSKSKTEASAKSRSPAVMKVVDETRCR